MVSAVTSGLFIVMDYKLVGTLRRAFVR
jgi:hypothetical protein